MEKRGWQPVGMPYLGVFLHQDSGVETKTGSESNPSEMDGWIQICITLNTNPDPLKTPTKDKT